MPRIARLAAAAAVFLSCSGGDRDAGVIEGDRRERAAVEATARAQSKGVRAVDALTSEPRALPAKRILFGDLHVHSSFSLDAFLFSLPVLAGEGAHPPADACDFARYCSSLDFFSLTDHAMGITPKHWAWEKESLRQCQARAGNQSDPDIVALAGFEWTQVGTTPDDHWGHKNVIFPGLEEDELPARVINSLSDEQMANPADAGERLGAAGLRWLRLLDPLGWRDYADFEWYLRRLAEPTACPKGVDTRELPLDCRENAPDPGALFEKLAQWGFPVLVIPHGNTWGLYSPPGTSFDKQLTGAQNDPDVQSIIEIMSGHGNSEEYRPWRAVEMGPDGEAVCPAPTPDYLPCCWRAGEIMRDRCGDRPAEECDALVQQARSYALEASTAPHMVFPDTRAEDWLDCGQCRDCFKPALGYRPAASSQYSLAISNFDERDEDGEPLRFRWSFIASSDNHTSRPGTGYKQYARRLMTEATGPRSQFWDRLVRWAQERQRGEVDPGMPHRVEPGPFGIGGADTERVASFLYPGGLSAIHAEGRSRHAVWDALQRGEVYGTSGPRILLWFDLLNGPAGALPMGSEVTLNEAPRFEVRAAGSFIQKDGCSEESQAALSPERLEFLCRGQCYHPGETRHPIVAIEVIRVRPQSWPGEPLDDLVEDPWRRFECPANPAGCTVRFEDEEFAASGRDAVYYVRAIQQQTPAINADTLRTKFDADGNPVSTEPCYGDFRTDFDDDCLGIIEERAWSSPIFVDRG
ncbi:MAG: DUF3604 domain-containing protein [Proteobacteria bacterium]|nr:DUF3604 domain-containing protein [Pseudomonadota bacterium]